MVQPGHRSERGRAESVADGDALGRPRRSAPRFGLERMRVPCVICAAMILPKTAELNGGLCGQCARNPAQARQAQERKRRIGALGLPSASAVGNELVRLTKLAADEACERFFKEGIYAFVLYAAPEFEAVVPRVMTEEWVGRMPSGARWGGSGWYDQRYMVMEQEFGLVAEWAAGLDLPAGAARGDALLPAYLDALQNVRIRGIFPQLVCLLLLSDGMGYEEIYALAETMNPEAALAGLRQAVVMNQQALASMRGHYRVFRCRAEPGAPPLNGGPAEPPADSGVGGGPPSVS